MFSERNDRASTSGEALGLVAALAFSSAVFYLLFSWRGMLPGSWTYSHVLVAAAVLALFGATLRGLLR